MYNPYVYMYICIYLYIYICIYLYMYICIYVYLYIYICKHTHTHIYIYIYISSSSGKKEISLNPCTFLSFAVATQLGYQRTHDAWDMITQHLGHNSWRYRPFFALNLVNGHRNHQFSSHFYQYQSAISRYFWLVVDLPL